MIELTCPKCSTVFEVTDGFEGRVCRCTDCGAVVSVPAAKADADDPADALGALAAAGDAASKSKPKPKSPPKEIPKAAAATRKPVEKAVKKKAEKDEEDPADALSALAGAVKQDRKKPTKPPAAKPAKAKPVSKAAEKPKVTSAKTSKPKTREAEADGADALAALAGAIAPQKSKPAATDSKIAKGKPAKAAPAKCAKDTKEEADALAALSDATPKKPVKVAASESPRKPKESKREASKAKQPSKESKKPKPSEPAKAVPSEKPEGEADDQPKLRKTKSHLVVGSVLAAVALLAIVGVVAFGIFVFGGDGEDGDARPIDAYANLFDIEHNPFVHSQPNIMGLPVENDMAILLDGSSAMRNQFDLIRRAISISAATLGPTAKGQVVIWTGSDPWLFPAEPTAFSSIGLLGMQNALEEFFPGGGINADAAFEHFNTTKPRQITMVCGELPDAATARAVEKQLDGHGIRLFVIHVDGRDTDPLAPEWETTAAATGGKYFTLSNGRLRRWHDEYQDQMESNAE